MLPNDEIIIAKRNTNIHSLINNKHLKLYPTGKALTLSDY
jgi:hypothetical protein